MHIASSQQPAAAAVGSQQQPVASSQKDTKYSKIKKQMKMLFSWVSEATFGTFPVYKGFKYMGKSPQKVDTGEIVSN